MSPRTHAICRVLYVEDTPEDQRLLGEAIISAGVAVELVTAASAQVALELLGCGVRFDVLLLDWNLPVVTGLEFLVAARVRQPDIPALVLTGEPGTVDLAGAAGLGAPTVLRKPLMLDDWEQLAVRLYTFCHHEAIAPATARP